MIAYDHSHEPPAPALQVTVANPLTRRLRLTVPALLDTGADVTAIPEACLQRLRLYAIRQIKFEDLNAQVLFLESYNIKLTIGQLTIPKLEAVLTGLPFAVIGRDVLNRFDLHLYGPRQMFEIM